MKLDCTVQGAINRGKLELQAFWGGRKSRGPMSKAVPGLRRYFWAAPSEKLMWDKKEVVTKKL